jgi:hypothetical protein
LEELEFTVTSKVRVLENGCLATVIDDLSKGGTPLFISREMTMKELREVATLDIFNSKSI